MLQPRDAQAQHWCGGRWLSCYTGYAGQSKVFRNHVYSAPTENVDTLVTFVMQLLQTSRWFRRRRAVGFDRAECAFGAVQSNCPSSSKSSRSRQQLHDNGDEGVHTLDGTYPSGGTWSMKHVSDVNSAIYVDFVCRPLTRRRCSIVQLMLSTKLVTWLASNTRGENSALGNKLNIRKWLRLLQMTDFCWILGTMLVLVV